MSRSDNIDGAEPIVLGFTKVQWAGIGLIALSFMAMIVHWSLAAIVMGFGVWLMMRPIIREHGLVFILSVWAAFIAFGLAIHFVMEQYYPEHGLMAALFGI